MGDWEITNRSICSVHPLFQYSSNVNLLMRSINLLKLFTYTVSTRARTSSKSLKLVHFANLILTTCMIFFVSHQIVFAQNVHIPDRSLRTVVEAALGKEAGEDITQADMASLQSLHNGCHFLTLSEKGVWWVQERWVCKLSDDSLGFGIRDLTGLELATNLTHLSLGRNQISDVSPLKNLTKLTYLDVGRNQISDVSPLKDLTNLTHLSLIYNSVSDISALKDLTELIELDLLDNKIPDISVLKAFTNLTHLSLRSNEIPDISVLKDLTNLM